jgi:hypothetical protein
LMNGLKNHNSSDLDMTQNRDKRKIWMDLLTECLVYQTSL